MRCIQLGKYKAYFCLTLSGAFLGTSMSACGQSPYTHGDFQSICDTIKYQNSTVALKYEPLVFFTKIGARAENQVGLDYPYLFCGYSCMETLFIARKKIFLKYNKGTAESSAILGQPLPAFLNGLGSGEYALGPSKSEKCDDIAKRVAIGNFEGVSPDDFNGCVTVELFDRSLPVTEISIMPDELYNNSDLKSSNSFNFGEAYVSSVAIIQEKADRSLYRNAFYKYPPGPSAKYCLEPREFTNGVIGILSMEKQ